MRKPTYMTVAIGFLVILGLIACILIASTFVQLPIPTPSGTVKEQVAAGKSYNSTLEVNRTPTHFPTSSTSPTRANHATQTIVPTPTILPSATSVTPYTPTEGIRIVKELLASNGNCVLPCWWGIQPGSTPSPDNIAFASRAPFHRITENLVSFDLEFVSKDAVNNLDYGVSVIVIITEGVVSKIKVSSDVLSAQPSKEFAQDMQALALHRVLTKFGVPTDVRLQANNTIPEPGAPLLFTLDIIYASRGVAIQYNGNLHVRAGKFMVCPTLSGITSIKILLTPSDDEDHFWRSLDEWSMFRFQSSIQKFSGMSITDFYSMFKESSNACFNPFTTKP